MQIAGLNKTTLLDYPGRVAATIFTEGCNFRCPFCHNADLVLRPSVQNVYSEEEVLSFLKKRKKVLTGICITGGEPTLQEELPDFIRKVRKIGYQVKLDTNGSRPDVLRKLLQEGLLDYVAVDIKNCKEKYALTTGCVELSLKEIEETVSLLAAAEIPYEFRTTVVRELHTPGDILKIGEWIAGCPRYFLQQYEENENEIKNLQPSEKLVYHSYTGKELEEIAETLRKLWKTDGEVFLRGVDEVQRK